MDFRLLFKILGGFLIAMSVILLLPIFYSFYLHDVFRLSFLSVSCLSALTGMLLWFLNKNYQAELNIKTSFAFVVCCWISACFIGALPYYFSYTLPNFVDSFFESCSGFTGTGASVIRDIEASDPVILLWRSLTQWLGGIGIIIFFIALLPLLGVGGVQVFKAESTGPQSERIAPRIKNAARNIWFIYFALTFILTVILYSLGMTTYDAVNHALTTMATGGFSTKNTGIAAFNSSAIDYTIAIFMIIASINFAIHFKIISFKLKKLLQNTELKSYLTILAIFLLIIFTANYLFLFQVPTEEIFRASFFTIAATVSSTGYTNFNYLSFPVFVHFLLLLLMLMGGMSGSTAGGIKCIRVVAAFKLLLKELKQSLHPHAVLGVKVNDRVVEDKTASAIWGFLFLYLFILSITSAVLCLEGIDLTSSVSATISMLSNIGPAFGDFGPFDNYASLSDISKMTLCIAMLLGRLEFLTILVLFSRDFWRKY